MKRIKVIEDTIKTLSGEVKELAKEHPQSYDSIRILATILMDLEALRDILANRDGFVDEENTDVDKD